MFIVLLLFIYFTQTPLKIMATPKEKPTAIRGVGKNSSEGGGLNRRCEAPKFVSAQCACARNSVNNTRFNTVAVPILGIRI